MLLSSVVAWVSIASSATSSAKMRAVVTETERTPVFICTSFKIMKAK